MTFRKIPHESEVVLGLTLVSPQRGSYEGNWVLNMVISHFDSWDDRMGGRFMEAFGHTKEIGSVGSCVFHLFGIRT